jgi:hypothetical protein
VNPLSFCYANDAHLRPDIEHYAGTTAAYVLGRANCEEDVWQRIKDRGSEIYKYESPISRPKSTISAIDEQIYMGDHNLVPLWPYRDASGNPYSNYPTTLLADIRIGSVWVDYYVDHVASVIRSKRYSGLFLDAIGAQLYTNVSWTSWPATQRAEWTAGAVDIVRRLDEVRRAENPKFPLVCNNHWETDPSAEKYIDGIVSENHPATGLYWRNMLNRPTYSPLGNRRVFVVTGTVADAVAWGTAPGVTHVNCTAQNDAAGLGKYAYATKPVVGYSNLTVSPVVVDRQPEIDALTAQVADLEDACNLLVIERNALLSQKSVYEDRIFDLNTQLTGYRAQVTTLLERIAEAKAALDG